MRRDSAEKGVKIKREEKRFRGEGGGKYGYSERKTKSLKDDRRGCRCWRWERIREMCLAGGEENWPEQFKDCSITIEDPERRRIRS